jgi:hypothetical protein
MPASAIYNAEQQARLILLRRHIYLRVGLNDRVGMSSFTREKQHDQRHGGQCVDAAT